MILVVSAIKHYNALDLYGPCAAYFVNAWDTAFNTWRGWIFYIARKFYSYPMYDSRVRTAKVVMSQVQVMAWVCRWDLPPEVKAVVSAYLDLFTLSKDYSLLYVASVGWSFHVLSLLAPKILPASLAPNVDVLLFWNLQCHFALT